MPLRRRCTKPPVSAAAEELRLLQQLVIDGLMGLLLLGPLSPTLDRSFLRIASAPGEIHRPSRELNAELGHGIVVPPWVPVPVGLTMRRQRIWRTCRRAKTDPLRFRWMAKRKAENKPPPPPATIRETVTHSPARQQGDPAASSPFRILHQNRQKCIR